MASLLSIVLFGEGIMTGLMLTVMIGPVTMIILRYGLQVNRMAGIYSALGTWISDFVFIGLTFWLTNSIDHWSHQPDIRLLLYLLGGFGLFLMGLLMLRIKQKPMKEDMGTIQVNYFKAFAAGFLVNSLSPFTLLFWLGIAVFLHVQLEDPAWYYMGVMIALASGDFAKAWMAPKLTIWLKEKYVYWIQLVAGILIAGTGLYIILLGFFE